MSERRKRPDLYSGVPWVQVTPEAARAHPRGRPGLLLKGIAAYLIVVGLIKGWALLGSGLFLTLLAGGLPILVGVGLLISAPWSLIAAVLMTGLTLYQLLQSMGQGTGVIWLVDALVSLGIIIYLMEGDRPNLIYRHRYRKYSVLADDGEDGDV